MKKIIIVIGVLLLISFGIEKLYSAEVEGVTDDLSGKTSKVIAVIEGDTIILSDGTRIQESESCVLPITPYPIFIHQNQLIIIESADSKRIDGLITVVI